MTTVLGLVTLAALTLSYLFAYSVAGALVDSNVLPHWPPGHDPRPQWMGGLFAALLVSALATFVVTKTKRSL